MSNRLWWTHSKDSQMNRWIRARTLVCSKQCYSVVLCSMRCWLTGRSSALSVGARQPKISLIPTYLWRKINSKWWLTNRKVSNSQSYARWQQLLTKVAGLQMTKMKDSSARLLMCSSTRVWSLNWTMPLMTMAITEYRSVAHKWSSLNTLVKIKTKYHLNSSVCILMPTFRPIKVGLI